MVGFLILKSLLYFYIIFYYMHKLVVIITLFLLTAPFVFAGACTDSDGGPVDVSQAAAYVTIAGTVNDQFGVRKDFCVDREQGRKAVTEGVWLREYYCFGAINKHRDYKCSDLGFEKCVTDAEGVGYCKRKAGDTTPQPVTKKVSLADFYCGGVPMNRADAECYPPGRLCVKDRLPGECSDDCKCSTITSDDEDTPEEETGEELAEDAGESTGNENEVTPAPTRTVAPVEKKPSPTPTKILEASPIKQTITLRVIASIAHFFKSVWYSVF